MNSTRGASPLPTRCSVRLLTYVVSLLISLSFGGQVHKREIERAVKDEVVLKFGNKVRIKRAEVHLSRPVNFKGNLRIKVKLSVREGFPRGSALVSLWASNLRRRVGVSLELLWKCRRFVVLEPVRKGERLFPHQVEEREDYVPECPLTPFKSAEELIDYVALRDIPPGREVKRNFLSKKPMVRAGERVTVLYRRGGLEISFEGIALEKGYYREEVSVKSLNTGRTLRGKVIADGTVMIR